MSNQLSLYLKKQIKISSMTLVESGIIIPYIKEFSLQNGHEAIAPLFPALSICPDQPELKHVDCILYNFDWFHVNHFSLRRATVNVYHNIMRARDKVRTSIPNSVNIYYRRTRLIITLSSG